MKNKLIHLRDLYAVIHYMKYLNNKSSQEENTIETCLFFKWVKVSYFITDTIDTLRKYEK